eukprot:gb/GECG01000004.1/.p1 GENE.gb/GECG01000004.1/~~gb/GECG01000004.1/.p1  ORF type:complete len:172 (+),score=9.21 gb/GECG01000004.1/:1-516(+)
MKKVPGFMLVRHKLETGFAFDKQYDQLVSSFRTANDLAEALNASNTERRRQAYKLMRHAQKHNHLRKSIGYYLQSGELVRNHHDRLLFVGRQERMYEDMTFLANKIRYPLNPGVKLRHNSVSKLPKFLSQRGINNLHTFFKYRGDYKAIEGLYQYGYIDDRTLLSYYNYHS